jgi:hypothetical protein
MKKKGRVRWMRKKSDNMENIPDTMERITELEMSLKDYKDDKQVYKINQGIEAPTASGCIYQIDQV